MPCHAIVVSMFSLCNASRRHLQWFYKATLVEELARVAPDGMLVCWHPLATVQSSPSRTTPLTHRHCTASSCDGPT